MKVILLTSAMSLCMGITAFAAGWQKDEIGWWWLEDNGGYPQSSWQWLDGNNDGVAECYYFNGAGYCMLNTKTPDGYMLNADGAWIVNNVVQTKTVSAQSAAETQSDSQGNGQAPQVEGTYKGIYKGQQVTGVIEKGTNNELWVEIDNFIKDSMPPYTGNNVFADGYTRYTFNGNVLTVEDLYDGETFQLTKQ